MTELLTLSATVNLFLLWRYFNLHAHNRLITNLLYRISRGEAAIRTTDRGVEIEIIKERS
jgi:hypothetical protein